MDRRRYIGLLGVSVGAAVTGYTGRGENNATEKASGERTSLDEQRGTGPAEHEQETEEPEEPEVVFGDSELLFDDSGLSLDAYAEVVAENIGDAASGQVKVESRWFDEDGNFLGDDTTYLPTLGAEETWIARVKALTVDAEDIERFEITGEFDKEQPRAPEGMTVKESELEVGEFSASIRGVAENSRDNEVSYVEAMAKLYDDEDQVIGGDWTNETDIPARTDWRFEIRLTQSDRPEEAVHHEVHLDSTAF